MILHIKIKNFAKVESADIALEDLIVFVGNNNSGKTIVMQLIYGVRDILSKSPLIFPDARTSDLNGQYLIRCDLDWFRELETRVNMYLDEQKNQIMESIFNAQIPVEEIKIALEGAETTYFVCGISENQSWETGERKTGFNIDIRQYEQGENTKSYAFEYLCPGEGVPRDGEYEALQAVWNIILSGNVTGDARRLFLPASRSGLQLLYKQYFAGGMAGDFVLPVKDFLQFLMLYTEEKQPEESRRILLTPFIKALSDTRRIDWLYCDEVENSLHPLLQREMARWLIRMVNAGMHVIVSSHSDTMASRLNNLFMLTHLHRRKSSLALLAELDLKEADLLRPDRQVGVYEFRSGKQGRTVVERLEFISHPLMGYDFRLFGANLDKLYDEADQITR